MNGMDKATMNQIDTTLPKIQLNQKADKAANPAVSRIKWKRNLTGYVFIFPWLVGFVGLTAGPLLFSLFASFTDYNITSKMNFIGLDNYKKMFSLDDMFWTSLWNTFYYVIFSVPLTTAGTVFVAVLLNQKIKGMKVFRTIFYLPAILSGVAVYFLVNCTPDGRSLPKASVPRC
jgi:multiple sugar transport system permease protein